LVHLWKEADVNAIDQYVRVTALRQNQLFPHLLRALIELSLAGSDERATLESISNHLAGKGVIVRVQRAIAYQGLSEP
jgi:hypothetical protein